MSALDTPHVDDVVTWRGLPEHWEVIRVLPRDHIVILHAGTHSARVVHASQCALVHRGRNRSNNTTTEGITS